VLTPNYLRPFDVFALNKLIMASELLGSLIRGRPYPTLRVYEP
jgi:hypothetical protein